MSLSTHGTNGVGGHSLRHIPRLSPVYGYSTTRRSIPSECHSAPKFKDIQAKDARH